MKKMKVSEVCLLIFLQWFIVVETNDKGCPICLPQKATKECQEERKLELKLVKDTLNLVPISEQLPIPHTELTLESFAKLMISDPVNRQWIKTYRSLIAKGRIIAEEWMAEYKKNPYKITKFTQYKDIFDHFINSYRPMNSLIKYPFEQEKFRDVSQIWDKDQYFAEQRLAGINPLTITRVTGGGHPQVGTSWNKLQNKLNPQFDWEKAVQNALGNKDTLDKVINDSLLFVLHHPSRDGLPTSDRDLTEGHIPGRKMRTSKSPIGLFVSKVGATDELTTLVPVAIQLDIEKDSAVYVPSDDDLWLLAKQELQLSDLARVQLIEHLVKTHLTVEPLCITMHRNMDKKHPLFQFLQWHCRGVLGTNFLGFSVLASEGGAMDTLFGMGHEGTLAMIEKGYKALNWDDLNIYQDLKNRGVEDVKVLPYYPYRDDGKIIMDTITNFVTEYVNIYYSTNQDVKEDVELQQFANEASADCTGKAKLKGFPPEIRTKQKLVEVISQFIWMTSAAHSVVGYPVTVYAAFTPNMPTKLYNVDACPAKFSISNFPGPITSAIQSNLMMNLGSLHYDQLLDYGDELKDPEAKQVTSKYYNLLIEDIAKVIRERNKQRYEEGHLTYPFLLPGYIPNSIHS